MSKLNVGAVLNLCILLFFVLLFSGTVPSITNARNVSHYSDTLSDSAPLEASNHTFTFTIKTGVPAGSYIDLDFPVGFVLPATSTFAERNVEVYVNGTPRIASTTATATVDGITITTGNAGSIRYTLNSTTGLNENDIVSIRVGNHTSTTVTPSTSYSTSTGTTTIPGDPPSIINASTTGTHIIPMTIIGASKQIDTGFNIALLHNITVGPGDTTETVPPYRFNGAPDGQIGGTTLSVEISLETDEFAICKWSSASGTPYTANVNVFENTGYVLHTQIVAVVPESLNTFYVRCIDDEGNYNTDDYIIAFLSPPPPSGNPNAEGEVEGDGTGSGNDGTGGGTGSGASSSGSDGSGSIPGNESGGGGSGGGGGGSSGDDSDGDVGGGFESSDGPYRSGDAEVIINGYAFPGSTVYAIVDGYVANSAQADDSGKYSVTVEEIARGAYTFGVYAIDDRDIKSTTYSTSFTVTGGRTSSLSNINIMPSILVSPDPVNPGETLTISGYAIPDATITIENQKDKVDVSQKTFTAVSDNNGRWSITVDTANFSQGTYTVMAKAEALDGSVETNFSNKTYYGVGQEAEGELNADLNRDGKVNLTDFSILLFWWGGDGGDSSPPADINGDGNVSLTDFSIMLFNWTG